MAKKLILLLQALLLVAAGGLVDGQLLGENDINTEPVDKAKDATKEKDSKFCNTYKITDAPFIK